MIENYYDSLAPFYKFIYRDWNASVRSQANALDTVIREFTGNESKTVLDVACGIGTQSIGLAKLGYRVTSSDLSSAEIEMARQEAYRYEVQIEFQVADMRQVWDIFQKQFDVVLACDNAIPHLMDDNEILQAFKQFYQCTWTRGCCIISVRDYAELEKNDREDLIYPRHVHQTNDGRIVLFDIWRFDGNYYEMTTYIVEDIGRTEAKTLVLHGGRCYCVGISTLEELFRKAGFHEVVTIRNRFFQPLIVAKK